MKNLLPIFIAALMLVFLSCQQHHEQSNESYQEEVKQQITEMTKLYLEAWVNKDLDSLMTFLDEDFINMFYFGMSSDKKQCREGFPNVFNNYSIEDLEYKITEIVADQNYAFGTMLFKQKWITNDKQDTIYFDMRSMGVYKKQEDGSWKLFWSIGQHNPNL